MSCVSCVLILLALKGVEEEGDMNGVEETIETEIETGTGIERGTVIEMAGGPTAETETGGK